MATLVLSDWFHACVFLPPLMPASQGLQQRQLSSLLPVHSDGESQQVKVTKSG